MKLYLCINIRRIDNSFKRQIFNLASSTINKRIMDSEDDEKQYNLCGYFKKKEKKCIKKSKISKFEEEYFQILFAKYIYISILTGNFSYSSRVLIFNSKYKKD